MGGGQGDRIVTVPSQPEQKDAAERFLREQGRPGEQPGGATVRQASFKLGSQEFNLPADKSEVVVGSTDTADVKIPGRLAPTDFCKVRFRNGRWEICPLHGPERRGGRVDYQEKCIYPTGKQEPLLKGEWVLLEPRSYLRFGRTGAEVQFQENIVKTGAGAEVKAPPVEKKSTTPSTTDKALPSVTIEGADDQKSTSTPAQSEKIVANNVIATALNTDADRPSGTLESVNSTTLRFRLQEKITIPTPDGTKTVVAILMSTDGSVSYELEGGGRSVDLAKNHLATIQNQLNAYEAPPADREAAQQLKERLNSALPKNAAELRDVLRERGEMLATFAQQLADGPKPAVVADAAPPPAQPPAKLEIKSQPITVAPKQEAVVIRGKAGHVEEVQNPHTGETRLRLAARDLSRDDLIRILEEQLKSVPEKDAARKPMEESLANLKSASRTDRELEVLKLNRQLREQGFEWTTDTSGKPDKLYRKGTLVAEIHPPTEGQQGKRQPGVEAVAGRRLPVKELGGLAVIGLSFYLMFRPASKQPLQLIYD